MAKKAVKKAKRNKAVKKAKKPARRYEQSVLGKLWGLSSNHCAYPGCGNRLIKGAVGADYKKIVGHICHIYGLSADGPRGKSGLAAKEKNSYENLILMCRTHHGEVDDFEGDYGADTLFRWKREHEAKAQDNTPEAIRQQQEAQKHAFFVEMSDEKIEDELKIIRQGRFLDGFRTNERALTFVAQVERIKFSSGHDEVRARALAWCARLLSQGDTRDRAIELLKRSREIAPTPDAALAEVFLLPKEKKAEALQALAKLNNLEAKSAMQRIVSNVDGNPAGYEWAKAAGLTVDSFDPEGKFLFVMNALIAHDWDLSLSSAENIGEADFTDCPALLHPVAMSFLVSTINPDLRAVLLSQVPFEADTFPLSAKPEDLARRKKARDYFRRISDFATSVGIAQASNVASDFALWLDLRDSDTEKVALEELKQSMLDDAAVLRRVNLAIRFGLKVDAEAIEAKLDQSLAMTGGLGTSDEAFARFSLAFAQKGAKEIAEYVAKHRAQLNAHIQKATIVALEVEALSRAGMIDSAKERLREAVADGLQAREEGSLNRLISEIGGADPIAGRRAQYEERKDLPSLAILVDGLEKANLQQELRSYVEELFQRTSSIESSERVARCLNALAEYDDLAKFMTANKALVDQSENLRMMEAWTLYREGDYQGALTALSAIDLDIKNPNVRRLRVNVAIASGKWDGLLAYADEVWTHRDELPAFELLQAANLSVAVNGPHSKDLVIAATKKEPENPQVLAAAYFQATSAGWEQGGTVAGWMAKAAEKSGNDGPIKMVSLNEFVKMQPDWNKKSTNVWDQLKAGQIPAFTAAEALNRSLLDFYLTPALVNPTETDIRRRNVVFAFSGARVHTEISKLKTLALDFAALLTLSHLGLLETVIAEFNVVIPNTTLGWLFQEKQKVRFHQPSRINDAKQLKGLIANKTLQPLNSEGFSDDPLRREVGPNLSEMLTAAKSRALGDKKVFVIHGAPIHKVGSMMLEEADVSGYSDYLLSPFAVLERLKDDAALLPDEEERARNYLTLQVKPWPNEAKIPDGSDIYLDGLAISNLRAAGLLPMLKKAGVKFYVEKSELEEADAFLAMENLGNDQLAAIEALRVSLSKAIEAGSVKSLRTQNIDEEEENILKLHPTYGVLSMTNVSDALVIDDRYINRHTIMTAPDGSVSAVLCTLDLLSHFLATGKITEATHYLYRNKLRQWGYQLIPLTQDELQFHLSSAKFQDGYIIENIGLKVIRESMLRARMGKLMQVPVEMPYLQQSLGSVVRTMKQKWVSASLDEARAFAEYALNLADIRAWAASALPGEERRFATIGHASHVLSLSTAPNGIDDARRAEFFKWAEESLIKPIKDYLPEVFEEIVTQFRRICVESSAQAAVQIAARGRKMKTEKERIRSIMFVNLSNMVPPMIKSRVLDDRAILKDLGLKTEGVFTLGNTGPEFVREDLTAAIKKVVAEGFSSSTITDQAGVSWKVERFGKGSEEGLGLTDGKRKLRIDDLSLLAAKAQRRLQILKKDAERTNLPTDVYHHWRDILKRGPITEDELSDLTDELANNPVTRGNHIADRIDQGGIGTDTLVPRSLTYYERLCGVATTQATINEYAEPVLGPFIKFLFKWDRIEGAKLALLLASHPLVIPLIEKQNLTEAELASLMKWALAGGDLISRCALIELGLRKPEYKKSVKAPMQKLIRLFSGKSTEANNQFEMFSATFSAVYGELGLTGIMYGKPVYWKRLAAMAQAAIICRAILSFKRDFNKLITWINEVRPIQFLLHCYTDYRTDPRWMAEFGLPNQIANEFGGRIFNYALSNEAAVKTLGLKADLVADKDGSLRKALIPLLTVLPGPVEGNVPAVMEMKPEEIDQLRSDLVVAAPVVESFSLLVSAVLLVKIPPEFAALSAEALSRAQYKFDQTDDPNMLSGHLRGLAQFAAISASIELADAILILIRNYRRHFPDELRLTEAFTTGIIACASRKDFREWCKAVGDFVTDFSFGSLTREEAQGLLPSVLSLCNMVPELWATCGEGLAAIEAVT